MWFEPFVFNLSGEEVVKFAGGGEVTSQKVRRNCSAWMAAVSSGNSLPKASR